MNDLKKKLLTIREAAEYLRIHPKTLYNLRSEGKGPKSRARRYKIEDLDVWLELNGEFAEAGRSVPTESETKRVFDYFLTEQERQALFANRSSFRRWVRQQTPDSSENDAGVDVREAIRSWRKGSPSRALELEIFHQFRLHEEKPN